MRPTLARAVQASVKVQSVLSWSTSGQQQFGAGWLRLQKTSMDAPGIEGQHVAEAGIALTSARWAFSQTRSTGRDIEK